MKFLPENLENYINGLLPPRDPVPAEMEELAQASDFPIIGPQVGLFLCQLAAVKRPKRIFEMGSGFGYSAYWLLRGAPEAHVVCTETRAVNVERGIDWLTRAGYGDRVTYHHGKAQDILEREKEPFDLILNDVDKDQYPAAFHLALAHLNPGGILVTDNVLWSGEVAKPEVNDSHTNGVREYNRLMFATETVQSSILSIRDGLGISVKVMSET